MAGGLRRVDQLGHGIPGFQSIQAITDQAHGLVLRRLVCGCPSPGGRYPLQGAAGFFTEEEHPLNGPGTVVLGPVFVAAIARDDQQFARLLVALPIIDNHALMPSYAPHQVFLPCSAATVPEVMAGFGEPANVGRVERLGE